MFSLKKVIAKATQSPIKVMASNHFLDAMNNINSVKEQTVQERDDKRSEASNQSFIEAKLLIDKCIQNNNFSIDNLKLIADQLIQTIENNRNNAEAYLNLAYVFYILGNNKSSAKYLRIATEINPNLEGLSKIRELISSIDNIKNEITSSEITRVTTSSVSKVLPVSNKVRNMYSISNKKF